MKKVVSFCLWGTNPHYLDGALLALASAREFYPGWEYWFYLTEDVPEQTATALTEGGGHVIRKRRGEGRPGGAASCEFEPAFWRFLPASDPEVGLLLVRDTDSPVTPREVAAVNEWLASDKLVHIMRDHPKHEYPMLAGMWGCRTSCLRNINERIDRWKRFDYYGCDQKFLGTVIYPLILNKAWIHSECIKFLNEQIHPFPYQDQNNSFIGISYTGDDQRLDLQMRYMKEWIDDGKPVFLRPLPWSIFGLIRLYSRGRWPKTKRLPTVALQIESTQSPTQQ